MKRIERKSRIGRRARQPRLTILVRRGAQAAGGSRFRPRERRGAAVRVAAPAAGRTGDSNAVLLDLGSGQGELELPRDPPLCTMEAADEGKRGSVSGDKGGA